MTKPIENCPVCQDKMFIRQLECSKCSTQIKSKFTLNKCDLDIPEDILSFIKMFIYTEGNIKQCEKLMNCSDSHVLCENPKRILGRLKNR